MVEVTFEYRDALCTDGKWRTQKCLVESVEVCKKFYGLGTDTGCEYRITSVKEIKGD